MKRAIKGVFCYVNEATGGGGDIPVGWVVARATNHRIGGGVEFSILPPPLGREEGLQLESIAKGQ